MNFWDLFFQPAILCVCLNQSITGFESGYFQAEYLILVCVRSWYIYRTSFWRDFVDTLELSSLHYIVYFVNLYKTDLSIIAT